VRYSSGSVGANCNGHIANLRGLSEPLVVDERRGDRTQPKRRRIAIGDTACSGRTDASESNWRDKSTESAAEDAAPDASNDQRSSNVTHSGSAASGGEEAASKSNKGGNKSVELQRVRQKSTQNARSAIAMTRDRRGAPTRVAHVAHA
jgi:hypothetical protein